ncbi:Uncharacterised protein [Mycobacteroides abscessus subsp. abscessus]|uniref:hypothetical protein n=1 Tax=Mycobacteroides abscessus TaxID=36809 RepID=UPI00092B27E0|nr:hypothetical protein [Mycobacteroides abscessus]SIH22299.1 Uncharacterised protein [Mycobacteroides abscessus subsp. abscessus]
MGRFYAIAQYEFESVEAAAAGSEALARVGFDSLGTGDTDRHELIGAPEFTSAGENPAALFDDAQGRFAYVPGVVGAILLNITRVADYEVLVPPSEVRFAPRRLTEIAAGDGGQNACGPDFASWFARGQWPRCACGFSPHDNTVLNQHWRDAGFAVVDNHGRLEKRPVAR